MESDVNYNVNPKCGALSCLSESNNDQYLECTTCKKKIHHCCTKLPAYQIGLFMLAETKANNSFLCEQCANVPEDLIQTCSGKISETPNTVLLLKEQLEKKDNELRELKEHIIKLETENPHKKRKFDDDCNDAMTEDLANKSIEIENLKKEITTLKTRTLSPGNQTEVKKLQTVVQNKTKEISELRNKNEKLSLKQVELQRHSSGKDNTNELAKLIEEKLSAGLNTIQTNMENFIKEKLTEKSPPDVTMDDISDKETTTYADLLKTGSKNITSNNFRCIMLEAKNEELAEQFEKRRREKNLIIHGKKEQSKEDDSDSDFFNQLVKDLQIGSIKIKQIQRIGTMMPNKNRPIKLEFNTEEDKVKVFNNLRNLKGKNDYIGISIKEDYTSNERKLIKQFSERAEIKNKEEEDKKSNIFWRVRGTPKNGLHLKWFTKAKQQTTIAPNQQSM